MKVHPFTESGLGFGPFHNPQIIDHGKAGSVACAYCGMGLRYEYIIKSADGKTFGVGNECVFKTHDQGLMREADAHKIALAKAKKEDARQKREAKRLADWEAKMAEVMPSGMTRKQEMEIEADKREQEVEERKQLIRSVWDPVIQALQSTNGGFARDWAEILAGGENWPRGRALDICLEITAKQVGRRGSKAFNAEWDRVADHIENGMAALDQSFKI